MINDYTVRYPLGDFFYACPADNNTPRIIHPINSVTRAVIEGRWALFTYIIIIIIYDGDALFKFIF